MTDSEQVVETADIGGSAGPAAAAVPLPTTSQTPTPVAEQVEPPLTQVPVEAVLTGQVATGETVQGVALSPEQAADVTERVRAIREQVKPTPEPEPEPEPEPVVEDEPEPTPEPEPVDMSIEGTGGVQSP